MTRELRISQAIAAFGGSDLDARYLAYFGCFNRQLYYEAHEVLESLWLGQRQGPNGSFYKGLIQLAGGFVHLQKGRPSPAAALLRLADTNLGLYSGERDRLDIESVRSLIGQWLSRIEADDWAAGPLLGSDAPQLRLKEGSMALEANGNPGP